MLLDSVSLSSLLLYGISGYVLWVGVGEAYDFYKLKRLGKRATVAPSWFPFFGNIISPGNTGVNKTDDGNLKVLILSTSRYLMREHVKPMIGGYLTVGGWAIRLK